MPKPIKLKGHEFYAFDLDSDDWSTLAAMIVIRRESAWYAREIDLLGAALQRIIDDVRTRPDSVRLLGQELFYIGRMDISGHRYSGELERIINRLVSQVIKGGV
ncbi:hypothetical protein [Streptomyces sp. NPDC050485]|uniref:hypothetical protein n=1 Tax=Streptomyces sp. NPDC050485 TaxID=3365617 RepID=UPI0037997481